MYLDLNILIDLGKDKNLELLEKIRDEVIETVRKNLTEETDISLKSETRSQTFILTGKEEIDFKIRSKIIESKIIKKQG